MIKHKPHHEVSVKSNVRFLVVEKIESFLSSDDGMKLEEVV